MNGPAISSTLLVAALDLNLVRLLRSAMNAPNPYHGGGVGDHVTAMSAGQAAQHTVNRNAGVRNADHPAATFEPSRVHSFHPRLNAIQPKVCDRPVMAVDAKPFIQPPWKVLPWPIASRPICSAEHRAIKAQLFRTDVSDVGRTLDLFI